MKTYILNLKGKATPDALHDYLASMLGLPEYYGRNLDALYDCLTSITAPTSISIASIDDDNELHKQTLCVFSDAADDNPKLKLLPKSDVWIN